MASNAGCQSRSGSGKLVDEILRDGLIQRFALHSANFVLGPMIQAGWQYEGPILKLEESGKLNFSDSLAATLHRQKHYYRKVLVPDPLEGKQRGFGGGGHGCPFAHDESFRALASMTVGLLPHIELPARNPLFRRSHSALVAGM